MRLRSPLIVLVFFSTHRIRRIKAADMKLLTYSLTSTLLTLTVSHPLSQAAEKRAPQIAAAHHVLPIFRQTAPRAGQTVGSKFRNLASFNARVAGVDPQPAGLDIALPADQQVEYLLNVTAGGSNYSLIIDTGSSDTWFVKNGFQCYNYAHQKVAQVACQFGPLFKGDFPLGQIAELHFNVSYGNGYSGPNLNGEYGYSE